MLNVRASYVEVSTCSFTSVAGDGGGTGMLLDNSKLGALIHHNSFFGVIDSGIEIGAYTDSILSYNQFYAGGKGLYLSSASADRHTVQDSEFVQLTTGIDYATAVGKSLILLQNTFAICTSNVSDVAAWGGGLWAHGTIESGTHRNVYPNLVAQAAAGVLLASAAAAYTQGNLVQIIPTATINKPITIQAINALTWSDDSTIYQIELFYGNITGTYSLDVYELFCGPKANNNRTSANIVLNIAIPARSYVGAKVSANGTNRTITVSLGYEAL
jgi:hypothetical protein